MECSPAGNRSGIVRTKARRTVGIASATLLVSVLLLAAAPVAAVANGAGSAKATTEPVGTQLERVQMCACEYMGSSVAVSGNTALVGERGDGDGAGRVLVYTESGGTWTQSAVLQGRDIVSADEFGASVAISGTTAVVGAPGHGGGHVYVFTETAGTWTQIANFTDPGTGPGTGSVPPSPSRPRPRAPRCSSGRRSPTLASAARGCTRFLAVPGTAKS